MQAKCSDSDLTMDAQTDHVHFVYAAQCTKRALMQFADKTGQEQPAHLGIHSSGHILFTF